MGKCRPEGRLMVRLYLLVDRADSLIITYSLIAVTRVAVHIPKTPESQASDLKAPFRKFYANRRKTSHMASLMSCCPSFYVGQEPMPNLLVILEHGGQT